jgi:hypothetical protein
VLSPKRKRYILTPWKVGAAGSVISIAFALPYAILTDVHRISLPGGFQIPTLYLVLFIPIVSIIWSCVGIGRQKRDGNLMWCFFGLFLSIAAIAFALVSTMSN